MNVTKIIGDMCYVDEITTPELPFDLKNVALVGDIMNCYDRLRKNGYTHYDSKRGDMFTDGDGHYVFFPDEKYNFAFFTDGVCGISDWTTKDVMLASESSIDF